MSGILKGSLTLKAMQQKGFCKLIFWIMDISCTSWAGVQALNAECLNALFLVCRLVSWYFMLGWFVYLFVRKEFKGLSIINRFLVMFSRRPLTTVVMSCKVGLCTDRQTSVVCRCTEQLSSSMSLTRWRTCLNVSSRSSACWALISALMGPGVFTATRASVSSPTGPSSSPSGVSSLSSTDTPFLDHMPCLLRS